MTLLEKIKNRTARIGVIGLGYVGLPLAVEKAKAGYKVVGFDIQQEKIHKVNSGENYIGDVVPQELKDLVNKGQLQATSDFSKISECDVISICVPTPLDKFKQPDLSYVENTAETISKYITKDTLVILESTTYPGTTEEVLKPILERTGLKVGKDIYLAFSPERVDPGNLLYKTKNTPKVVGGCTALCTERAKAIYENVLDAEVFTVSSPKEAEMTKILENTFRIVNCALANEMAIVCEKMGVNIWEVIAAASTKPFGFVPFYPGPGVGGHCIPIDPFYLTYKARSVDYHTRLIELAGEINDYMPEYVVHRISALLNGIEKPIKNSNILLIGVSYKGDIDDLRESPALKVWELLEKSGANLSFYDPCCSSFRSGESINHSLNSQPENFEGYDMVVITSAHKKGVDYKQILEKAPLILDTKNIISQVLDIDPQDCQNLNIL